MASYTTNYQLHQWVPEDNFLRTDFNQDFQRIDTAIKGVETGADAKLAQKADKTALTSLAATVDGKAEIVTGSYTGSGGTKTVSLGFRPKLVVVPLSAYYTAAAAAGGSPSQIFVTSNGFSAQDGGVTSPNESGRTYYYAALR